jgi:DNA-binding beta-propeller fold protein YncE
MSSRAHSLGLLSATIALALGGAPACGSSSTEAQPSGDAGTDVASDAPADVATDAPADAPPGCVRTPAAADRARKLVASHPYDASAAKAKVFEVLDLSATGTLSRPSTPVTFQMGVAFDTPIVFTSDGAVGLVAQDDGTIGVFRLDASGPVVVHAAYKGDFYADRVLLSPDGARAFVLDSNTLENGGGVYEFAVACDGTLTPRGHVVSASGTRAMQLFPGDPSKALIYGTKVTGAAATADVHLFDTTSWTRLGSGTAFASNDAIPSDLAITPDGKFAFVADDGAIVGNRVEIVSINGTTLANAGELSTPYPDGIAVSPWGNAAFVMNDDSTDQIHIFKPSSSGTTPWSITGELAYKFGKPQIPVSISTIDRGGLKGTAFVGENLAVRQLQFTAAGDVVDTAKLAWPDAMENIVGVVGVQP